MERLKIRKCDGFSSLICSEWYLSLLFPYLVINDIGKLDLSICNREERKSFLTCLSKLLHKINFRKVTRNRKITIEDMVDWIVHRKLNISEIYLCSLNSCRLKFAKLLRKNRQLKTMHLSFIEKYPADLLSKLGKYCFLLEDFSLELVDNVSWCPLKLANKQIEAFVYGCRLLKTLKFRNIKHEQTDILMRCLGKYSSKLEALDISSVASQFLNVSIETDSIEFLVNGCTALKYISLMEYTITDEILSKLTNIEKLTLNKCLIFNLEDFEIGKLSKLKSLHLKNMKDIANECIRLMFTVVEHISVISCNEFSDNIHCPCVKQIELSSLKNITDQGIKNLFKAQLGNTLEDIHIRNCKNISHNSLLSIAANCPHLKKINIYNMENVSDESLWELFHKCEKLIDMTCNVNKDPSSLSLNSVIPIELQFALNKRKAIMTSHYLNS